MNSAYNPLKGKASVKLDGLLKSSCVADSTDLAYSLLCSNAVACSRDNQNGLLNTNTQTQVKEC